MSVHPHIPVECGGFVRGDVVTTPAGKRAVVTGCTEERVRLRYIGEPPHTGSLELNPKLLTLVSQREDA